MSNIFETRRSVNFFDPSKPLDKETLKKIIDLAVTAPSAFNLQPWDIIAVTSDEAKEKLFQVSNQQPKIKEAPVTLIIVGNLTGYQESNPIWKELEKVMGEGVKGAKDAAAFLYGSTEERKVKFAESNAGLLGMSIMYAAEHYGVQSHAMSGIDFDGIKDAFNLKENQQVVMTIALGYFDETKDLFPRAYRRGYDEVVTTV